MPLHEALTPLAWLAGRWTTTRGVGKFPTIEEFSYHEILEFSCIGQTMFNFQSTSSHPIKKTPMHQERGFLRVKTDNTNTVALVVAHNFGITTVEEGIYSSDKKEINLKSKSVSRISFAKHPHVKCLSRSLRLIEPDKLEMVVCMETESTGLTEHLHAIYTREEL